MQPTQFAFWSELDDRLLAYQLVGDINLVIVRFEEEIRVIYGRDWHRAALMAVGYLHDHYMICPAHHRNFRLETSFSE